jgi:hypothetical protein
MRRFPAGIERLLLEAFLRLQFTPPFSSAACLGNRIQLIY